MQHARLILGRWAPLHEGIGPGANGFGQDLVHLSLNAYTTTCILGHLGGELCDFSIEKVGKHRVGEGERKGFSHDWNDSSDRWHKCVGVFGDSEQLVGSGGGVFTNHNNNNKKSPQRYVQIHSQNKQSKCLETKFKIITTKADPVVKIKAVGTHSYRPHAIKRVDTLKKKKNANQTKKQTNKKN